MAYDPMGMLRSPFAQALDEDNVMQALGMLQQPAQGVLQRPMQQQASGVNAFLNSPGMAMAAQGLNNMSALRRGGVPRQTPVGAYQQAANRNDILLQRKEALQNQKLQMEQMREYRNMQMQQSKSQEERAAEKFETSKNPQAGFQ